MFEDATFESTGRIHTGSRKWMPATLALNGTALLALVLIPLMHPEALPQHVLSLLLQPPQPEQPRAVTHEAAQPATAAGPAMDRVFQAPRLMPNRILIVSDPEPRTGEALARWNPNPGMPGNGKGVIDGHGATPVVRPSTPAAVRVSGSVVDGLLIRKTLPEYPALAKTIHVQGTVVLQATISKQGTIENLRVVSGPALLQQAALTAVKTWLYRPYLLSGQPVEVETTVSVVFRME
ncbi:MAG TPA: energy transducer TonB [Terracidiphilus sp.]|nr:energy transducer TonB [Terracidiphilus sp.]